jgi:hypothetical protein
MILSAAGAALHCLGDPARTAGAWQLHFQALDVVGFITITYTTAE